MEYDVILYYENPCFEKVIKNTQKKLFEYSKYHNLRSPQVFARFFKRWLSGGPEAMPTVLFGHAFGLQPA